MIFERQSKHKIALLSVAAVLLVAGAVVLAWLQFMGNTPIRQCTQEAKLCPDGTYVGRTGPNCDFAPCPDNNSSWKTYTDTKQGISIQYPEKLTTKYIFAYDWPPQVQILEQPYSCLETGALTDSRSGLTTKRFVDGREYCVTLETGAAAGSVYNQYAYAFAKDDKTAILTFTLQLPQCGNYDEPDKSECEAERTAFDIDATIDRIAQTLTIQ